MSIWSFLSSLFNELFNATKAAWNKLPATVQTGILNGSGILNIIAQYIGQDPALTLATINANYPNEVNLYNGLAAVAKSWGLTVPDNASDLIVAIQTYLKAQEGSEWDRIMSIAAQVLADIFTGDGTPFEIIVTVIQWVYTNLIKPAPITYVPAPTPVAIATPNPVAQPVVAVPQ